MGAYGVTVEKQITFRGVPEIISQTYHYRITAPVALDYDALADAVVAKDKAAYPTDAQYKTVRVYGPTEGSKADNQMRLVKDLSGNGTRTNHAGGSIYPEVAVVMSKYVGRSPVHNRKVFVRKFIHPLRIQVLNGIDIGTLQMQAAEQTFWGAWHNGLDSVTQSGITFNRVTPRDVLVPTSNNTVVLNYAHIRQLKQ